MENCITFVSTNQINIMKNERFYPAIEKNDKYIVKDVFQIQLGRPKTVTHKKSVMGGDILLGIKAYDTYSELRGHYTETENVYKK